MKLQDIYAKPPRCRKTLTTEDTEDTEVQP
jgi:hypothetical protein